MQRQQQLGLLLSLARGFSPRLIKQLYEAFGSAERLFCASQADLQRAQLSVALIRRLRGLEREPCPALAQTTDWLAASHDHHLLCLDDSRYPVVLRQIDDPPPCLFVKGDPELLHYPQLAVVGSRKVSAQGVRDATRLAQELSEAGLIPVSGLALGVDACAHRGALAGQGLTVAVLGSGVDRVAPLRHQGLAAEILAAGGALVSEFPLGTPPLPAYFPRRNRIISGLSRGVLVVEAAERSGSLITARLASEQGREVFALPGSIHNPGSRGCHQLIRQGATLVTCCADILTELGPTLGALEQPAAAHLQPATRPASAPSAAMPLPAGVAGQVLAACDFEPTPLDLLVERCGLGAAQVQSELLALELGGWVEAVTGGYQRC